MAARAPKQLSVWSQMEIRSERELLAVSVALAGKGANGGPAGSLRFPGSRNFKPERQAEGQWPMVRLTALNPGRTVTAAELRRAGLMVSRSTPGPVSPRCSLSLAPAEARGWPDYQRCLDAAPRKAAREPDRSWADMACSLLTLDRVDQRTRLARNCASCGEGARARRELRAANGGASRTEEEYLTDQQRKCDREGCEAGATVPVTYNEQTGPIETTDRGMYVQKRWTHANVCPEHRAELGERFGDVMDFPEGCRPGRDCPRPFRRDA